MKPPWRIGMLHALGIHLRYFFRDQKMIRSTPKPLLIQVTATALIFIVMISVVKQINRNALLRVRESSRMRVARDLARVRGAAEQAINHRVYLTQGLRSFVALNPELTADEFDAYASLLLNEGAGIRSVTLIRDGVIEYVSPLEGNEAAIGLNILEHPDQKAAAEKAIKFGQPYLTGPVELAQGGSAFINRAPVVFAENQGSGQPGLMVSILIDKDLLVEEILQAKAKELRIAIQGRNESGEPTEVFAGEAAIRDQSPEEYEISLPTGDWTLYGIPGDGWPKDVPEAATTWLTGFTIWIVLSTACLAILRRHSFVVERMVQERTDVLAAAQDRLHAERKETQTILDSIPAFVFFKSRDNRILRVNQAVVNSLGLPRDQIEGRHSREVYPQDADRFYQDDLEVMNTKKPKLGYVEPVGDLWVRTDKIPIENSSGAIDRILVVATDVTAIRRKDSRLRELGAIIEFSINEVYLIDPTSLNYLFGNEAGCSKLGYTRKELLALTPLDVFPELNEDDLNTLIEPVAEDRLRKVVFEAKHLRKDGTTYDVEVHWQRIIHEEKTVYATLILDISERKSDEARLRKTRELLELTNRMAKVGGWEVDLESMTPHWSDEVCRIHEVPVGYQATLDEALQFYPGEARKMVTSIVENSMKTGEGFDWEMPFVTAKGNKRWVRSIGIPEFKDGQCVKLSGSFQDITERKEAERKLRITQRAIDAASVATFFVQPDGTFSYVNEQTTKYLGYTRDELCRMRVSDIAPRNPKENWPNFWEQITQEGQMSLKTIHLRKDGTEYPCEVHISHVTFEDEELLLAFVHDVTLEKRERELRRVLFERSTDAHLLFDGTGILECNQAAVDMLAMDSKEELLGYHPAKFSPEFQPDGQFSMEKRFELERIAHEQGFHRFDWIHQRKDGTPFPCEVTLNPVNLETGPALLVVWHDITDRVKSQEMLANYAKQLETSNEELKQFAYVASHDLRAPLRGIRQLVQWIGEDLEEAKIELPTAASEFFGKIIKQIAQMDGLLNGLLEYSRAGRRRYNLEKLNSREVIDTALALAAIPIEFECKMEGEFPEIVTERSPLERTLLNLITNAAKHHDQSGGRITITCRPTGQFVRFSVSDDGPGIPGEHHARVFEIFQTLKPKGDGEGSGMGLSIVKRLVESYGGEIGISANEGRGTTMWFTWPLRAKDEG